jgi:DUF438 domain-containing protein
MAEFLDNAAARRHEWQRLFDQLLAGKLSPQVIEASRGLIEDARAADVVELVDLAVESGLSLERLAPAVSKLLNLLSRPLAAACPDLSGDPLAGLLEAENRAMLAALDGARAPLASLNAAVPRRDEAATQAACAELATLLRDCAPLELHYARLENVVFPYFEARHPRYRCLSLMWHLHDEVRGLLKSLPEQAEALSRGQRTEPEVSPVGALASFNAAMGRLFFTVHNLVFREEKLLFVVAMPLLSEEEKLALAGECVRLGRGFIPEERCAPARTMSPPPALAEEGIALDAGALSPGLIDALLKALPVDVTLVDRADRVAYFSNGPHRIFPRSPAIIGREVRNCHPAGSVDRVMAIIDAFRTGSRDREAFWIEKAGRFIHIEYRALRDAAGTYLGTLEISEDITEKRALRGEKRLASP